MADEENLDLEEGEEEGEQTEAAPKKKFGLSPMIVKILMGVAAILVVALISGLIAFFVSKTATSNIFCSYSRVQCKYS